MRRSGKYAYVDGIPCITQWEVSARSSVQRYSASCSPDGTATTEGNINWSGSMAGVGYLPPFPTEDDFAFIGVASAKSGEVVNYEGDILVNQVTLSIPVAAGTPITWSAQFGVQGALVKTTTPAYFDPTREPGPSGKHGDVRIESVLDSGTFASVDKVQSIQVTFRRGSVDSVDDGLVYRESGNLEADLNFSVDNDDLEEAAYALNQINRVRVYVSPTEYFLFDSIQWSEHSSFRVVRDPPTIIGYNVNGMWTALRTRSPDELGTIVLPNGGILYGEEET